MMKFLIKISLITLVLISFLHSSDSKLSDKRLCADPNCSELISTGRTLIRYGNNQEGVLSFKPNVKVKIFSKSAGKMPDFWGVEIDSRRGYVPRRLIKEEKIYKKKLEYIVPVEELSIEEPEKTKETLSKNLLNPVSVSANQSGQGAITESLSTDLHLQPSVLDTVAQNPDKTAEHTPLWPLPSFIKGVSADIPHYPKPDSVPPFEVIEGTRVYLSPGGNVIKSDEENNKEEKTLQLENLKANINTIQEVVTVTDGKTESEILTEPATSIEGEKTVTNEASDPVLQKDPKPESKDHPNTEVENSKESLSVTSQSLETAHELEMVSLGSTDENIKAIDTVEIKGTTESTLVDFDDNVVAPAFVSSVTESYRDIELHALSSKDPPRTVVSDTVNNDSGLNEPPVEELNLNDTVLPAHDLNNNRELNVNSSVVDDSKISKPVVQKVNLSRVAQESNVNVQKSNENNPESNANNPVKESNSNPVIQESIAYNSVLKESKNSPLVKESNVIPVAQELNSNPVVQESSPSPVVKESNVKPVDQESNLNSVVHESSLNPVSQESIVKSFVMESKSRSGNAEESNDKPVQDSNLNSIATESNVKNPTVLESNVRSGVQDSNLNQDVQESNANIPAVQESIGANNSTVQESSSNDSLVTESVVNESVVSASKPDINVVTNEFEITDPASTESTEKQIANNEHVLNVPSIEIDPSLIITDNTDNKLKDIVIEIQEKSDVVTKPIAEIPPFGESLRSSYNQDQYNADDGIKDVETGTEDLSTQRVVDETNDETEIGSELNNTLDSISVESDDLEQNEPTTKGVKEESVTKPSVTKPSVKEESVTKPSTTMDDIVNLLLEPSNEKVEQLGEIINNDNVGTDVPLMPEDESSLKSGPSAAQPEEGTGFFDGIFSGWFKKSDDIKEDSENSGEVANNEQQQDHSGLVSQLNTEDGVCRGQDDHCPKPDPLDEFLGLENLADEEQSKYIEPSWESLSNKVVDMDQPIYSSATLIYLAVTAVTVLIFTLGHYYIEKLRQDGSLLSKVNILEKALMVSSKECVILKNDLTSTCNKLDSIKEGAFGSNEEVISLKEEKYNLELMIIDKEEHILLLEKELESATETGLELNKMLQDVLNAQKSDTITESVENMQAQLNEQKETINIMNSALAAKSRENSGLQVQLAENKEQLRDLQEKLDVEKAQVLQLQERCDKSEIDTNERSQNLQLQLNEAIAEKICEVSRLSEELQALQNSFMEVKQQLEDRNNQVKLLETYIQKVKAGSTIDMEALANTSQLQASIQRISKERDSLIEQLSGEQDARKLLEDHVKVINEEVQLLRTSHHQAERDKVDAQTRLEVLSGYFKEKETQLQKELGFQEALWQQKQGEATSTVDRLHAMQDEIDMLKSQNNSLREEIEQQTSAHRIQIGSLESRVHEAWLGSRHAERRLEESRAEAGALRRRLTAIAEQESIQKRMASPLEAADLAASSPLHLESPVSPMMPPPHPFLPPPFLPPPLGAPPFMPPFLGEMRPPPLGRLPSPPPPGHYSPGMASERYSPESRFSPESRYSPDREYRRPMSPYDTETDISPPQSPYRQPYNQSYNKQRRDDSRRSKGPYSGGSSESITRNQRHINKV